MSDLDYSPALNEDGTEFDIVKAAEIAKGYAPENVLGALRDAAEQAHGFMHYGPFTDCEAEICVQRFKLSRAATRPAEDSHE
jgi:hypothetical protein